MTFDSHSWSGPSTIVGTSAFGFIARYSGGLVTPKAAPASTRSKGTPSHCAARTTLRTLMDEMRPQTFSTDAPSANRLADGGRQRGDAGLDLRARRRDERKPH